MLPPSGSDRSESAMLYRRFRVSLAIFACLPTVCACPHVFGVPARFLDLAWSFVGYFSGSRGELGSFAVSWHVLMVCIAMAVVTTLIRMYGASLCLFDASDNFPGPSVVSASRFASLPPNFIRVPSLRRCPTPSRLVSGHSTRKGHLVDFGDPL